MFNEKLLVVYTGKQRLAKIVLSNVVENYILRKDVKTVLHDLKIVAKEMFRNFKKLFNEKLSKNEQEEIISKIGKLLTNVNSLNVKLSPKANDGIQEIFYAIDQYVYGSCVIGNLLNLEINKHLGAGSGGY